MQYKLTVIPFVLLLLLGACGGREIEKQKKSEYPTFLPGCFRREIVSEDYSIPELKSAAEAAYIQNRLKTLPGYMDSTCDLIMRTITVSYKSSTIRKMNFEEAIAHAGFSVNYRPANPTANIPQNVK